MSSFSKIFQIFSKGFCKSLVFYFSFYLIFSPLFSFQAFAQSLPINPISNNANLVSSKFQIDDATFKKIEKVYAEAKRTNYNNTLPGLKGAGSYANDARPGSQLLPFGEYKEFDLDPKIKGVRRNMERIVIEKNSGKVYYTNNHYETFVEITEELTKGK